MPNFELKTGKVIGYEHLRLGHNCQDAIASEQLLINNEQFTIVVISDGSTVAEDNPHAVHTEVGASLTVEFLLKKTKQYLLNGLYLPILPFFLFDDLLDYYNVLIKNQNCEDVTDLVTFVKHHLLCTALILVVTPKYGMIMRYGDGLIVINNQVYTFDYNDHPPYIAYHTIPQHLKINANALPKEFEVLEFDPKTVTQIAIGSDAFVNNQELIPMFWGHKHTNQIQRNLNVWSKVDHKLIDDASLAVLEKKGE